MGEILIVEDDQEIAELLNVTLQYDYELHFAYSGTEAIYKLEERKYNLILLDLMLPGLKGDELLSRIRKTSNTPVIVLTALHNQTKVVELLNNGANDYITKPFHIDELKARVDVQLRNQLSNLDETQEVLQYKNLKLNLLSQEAMIQDKVAPFTKKEFRILQLLLRHPKRVFSKQELYELIWKKDYLEDENTINVHISSIRRKFEQFDKENTYIETVWGIGIRLMGEPQ